MRTLLLAAMALGLAACGGGGPGSDRPGEDATLLLDFAASAVHAGIYSAAERGYDDAEGVALTVQTPGQSTDALKLLAAREADFAVLDIHDLGLASEKGADLVAVMAIVQRPLAAVLARPGIRSPRDLAGRKAGVSGLPSDDAVLRAVIEGDGGEAGEVEKVTIGFESVKALVAGRVDAATAFWNVEGIELRRRNPDFGEFRVDDFGAPAYPELVLVTTRRTLDERRPLVDATVRAVQRGYVETQTDPESAITTMLSAERELDRDTLMAQLDAVAPAFTAGADFVGQLRPEVLREWAAWAVEFGILERPPDVGRHFATDVAQPISRN